MRRKMSVMRVMRSCFVIKFLTSKVRATFKYFQLLVVLARNPSFTLLKCSFANYLICTNVLQRGLLIGSQKPMGVWDQYYLFVQPYT